MSVTAVKQWLALIKRTKVLSILKVVPLVPSYVHQWCAKHDPSTIHRLHRVRLSEDQYYAWLKVSAVRAKLKHALEQIVKTSSAVYYSARDFQDAMQLAYDMNLLSLYEDLHRSAVSVKDRWTHLDWLLINLVM